MKRHLPLIALAVVVAACLVVGAASLSRHDFGMHHDDGIYAVTAKSLAQSGEYRITSLPDEPAQRKYPVLFPAVLSLVWRLCPEFPENIVWMKAVSLLAGAAFVVLTYGFLRRAGGFSRWGAVAGAAACAFAPATGELADSAMSGLLYAAVSIGALWMLERLAKDGGLFSAGVLAGILAGCAYLTRSVGLALVLAMVVSLAWHRRWRLLIASAIGAAAVIVPLKLALPPAEAVPRACRRRLSIN